MKQENNKDKFLKLFGKGKDQKDNEPIEKPIVLYYAKYIGVLGSNKSFPTEEGAYVRIHEDRIEIELLKSKFQVAIPYKNMTDVQHIDGGKKFDLEKGVIGGLIWKRHHIVTVIKYDDNALIQTIALDFQANTKYAQPLIYKKMQDIQQQRKIESLENAVNQPSSIADELIKIAKLKEQGVITEEEFSQIKSNLMKRI